MSIELLDMNHRDAVIDAFEKANGRIRIISPFVQGGMSKYLVDSLDRGITAQLITRFYREDFIQSVSSLTALKSLQSAGADIYALKDLHAKLYLFDDNLAIIGSANFTGGGFGNNIELSLYIEDEYDLIERLSKYFDQLLSTVCTAGDFKITETKIEEESLIVQKAVKGRDRTSKSNPTRFGAVVDIPQVPVTTSVDELENILGISGEGISAVLKFEGSAHRRIDPDGKYKPNHYDRKGIYFTASSKSPRSLTEDTTVFLSAVSWDKSGAGVPIIVGRAKTRGYDKDNNTDGTLIKEHPWAVDFPFYIELYDIETVDTEIRNCISLNDLIGEVGYKLYPNTEKDPTISIPNIKTRHHQKAYIAITSYAANRTHTMLEGLFKKYGKSTF
ncbi:MAG: phospholipase D family protein [Herbinix sp.]|nr:phospholipase D family protein [Herbinix sp.]